MSYWQNLIRKKKMADNSLDKIREEINQIETRQNNINIFKLLFEKDKYY